MYLQNNFNHQIYQYYSFYLYRSKSIVPQSFVIYGNVLVHINDACYLKSLTKFPLKLYLKACPCIYGTILTIKFTSIISSLQVKEYCPLVFRNLRKRFGIDDACYLKSLTKAPQPMEPPTGRSGGAKFYTSQDHIYTIKACPCFQSSKI